jgi:ribosome-associated toxin RatA of RatAB toxin-antitoxin module
MYELVNDIAAYPSYMDGCVWAEVLVRDDVQMVARLELAKAGVKQSFTTRNQLVPGRSIIMQLEQGPFDDFGGDWTFQALGASACRVSLDLHFSMPGRLASAAARRLVQTVGSNLVDALCKRAKQLYG